MSNNATSPPNRKAALSPAAEAERLEALLCHLERLLPDNDPGTRRLFRDAILTPAPLCVRVNRLMASHARAVEPGLAAAGQTVAWCPDAFVLPDRAEDAPLGSTLECALGAVYVQAKATTLAAQVLAPQPGERVLDLAAAPGGKATHLASRMDNHGLLVCNEPRQKRMSSLVGNLERCGAHHTVLTAIDGAQLARSFHNVFDRVLLDAPCSGDGIIAKSRGQLAYWSPEDACRKSNQQIGLLRAAFHMLRPGGHLVYSTCSLSTEENEDVLIGLLRRFPEQARILPIADRIPVDAVPLPDTLRSAYPDSFDHCIRIWPHVHQTEGGFVALIGKSGTTTWDKVDATLGLEVDDASTDDDVLSYFQDRWGVDLEVPSGQTLARGRRQISLQPSVATAWAAQLPSFVRAGMRLCSVHKDRFYLSQQMVGLWGDAMTKRRVELTWPQVQQLFAHNELDLTDPSALRGEVVCSHGPWQICRGLVVDEGRHLVGYIPRGLRHASIERLVP